VKSRGASQKVKVTTRCIVVPPSPTHSDDVDEDDDDGDVDSNNNDRTPTPDADADQADAFNAQQQQPIPTDCTTDPSTTTNQYTRNRSTTRSWPVIYRNNSVSYSSSTQHQQLLEPSSKTEQLQNKRKSSHQYDFDQIFGLNNANYQQYLASASRKASACNYDKSPSIYDMQHIQNVENDEQTQSSGICYVPPTVIFLFITLLMTTSATSMLCAAIMTDHWENVTWDRDALIGIVNQSTSARTSNQLEFLLDGKVARLPFKGE